MTAQLFSLLDCPGHMVTVQLIQNKEQKVLCWNQVLQSLINCIYLRWELGEADQKLNWGHQVGTLFQLNFNEILLKVHNTSRDLNLRPWVNHLDMTPTKLLYKAVQSWFQYAFIPHSSLPGSFLFSACSHCIHRVCLAGETAFAHPFAHSS